MTYHGQNTRKWIYRGPLIYYNTSIERTKANLFEALECMFVSCRKVLFRYSTRECCDEISAIFHQCLVAKLYELLFELKLLEINLSGNVGLGKWRIGKQV